MDLNTILCRGRADMYGTTGGLPACHFRPVVSSFKMDSLRASVRKEKPGSRPSSRGSSGGSSGSPSKSILRGQEGSPKFGSPSDNRSVRFRDSRADRAAEYSRIHVNETTQTNGWDSSTVSESRVQVYSSDGSRGKKDALSSMDYDHGPLFVAKTFKAPPVYTSTPRIPRDTSPARDSSPARHRSPARDSVPTPSQAYVVKQQRELPKTPVHRVETQPPMAVRKGSPSGTRGPGSQPRQASATQTPAAPSGHRIIQNMDFGGHQHHSPREYVKSPRIDMSDGHKIVQNMDLGHIPHEKNVAIQTQTDMDFPNEVGIQTDNDVETQTPRDAEVQTPRDVSVQTPADDEDLLAEDDDGDDDLTGDISSVSHAYSQTVSDEEEAADSRDMGCQTPRDVGVQTPREVSVQTSDTSDEEEEEEEEEYTADAASQTPAEHDASMTTQKLDTYTNVWSTSQPCDDGDGDGGQQQSSFLSSGEEDSRLVDRLPRPSFADLLTEVSDDEEVGLPPHLTEPFPHRDPVYAYDKLKTSPGLGQDTSDSRPGVLIEHSAKQLLERATSPIPHPGSLPSKSSTTPRGAFIGPDATQTSIPKQQATHTTHAGRDLYQVKRDVAVSNSPETLHDAGTQFHSDYHLALQAKEDKLKEIAATLDFTPIESHSFDPGLKQTHRTQLPAPVPDYIRDIRENQMRNALIKDVNLGPVPTPMQDRHDNRDTYNSPPRPRIVKSVDFDRSVRDRYRDNKGPSYIFFKNTPSGSKYESFDPQPRQSARRPHSSYTSPPRSGQYRSRPSSAPAKSTPAYPPTSSYLTPALNYMRKQAIRKSVTDHPSPCTKSKSSKPSGQCHRSDTFISSTKPPPQPLTLPLTNVTPSVPRSPDIGSFETLGNQPRYVTELTSTSNCRPVPKRKSRTPSPAFRLHDQGSKPTSNKRGKSPDGTNNNGFATSCKPPLPRGRTRKKDSQYTPPHSTSRERKPDTSPKPAASKQASTEPRSRSVDSHVKRFRDAGSSTNHHGRQSSRKTDSKHTTISTSTEDHHFFGNEAIQRIIEKAKLSSV